MFRSTGNSTYISTGGEDLEWLFLYNRNNEEVSLYTKSVTKSCIEDQVQDIIVQEHKNKTMPPRKDSAAAGDQAEPGSPTNRGARAPALSKDMSAASLAAGDGNGGNGNGGKKNGNGKNGNGLTLNNLDSE